MKNENPLNNFNTDSYAHGFRDVPTMPTVCPTLSQSMANPLKLVDYISCHKLLMIFLLAIVALLFYSGVKAKAAAEGTGGKGGAPTPGKK